MILVPLAMACSPQTATASRKAETAAAGVHAISGLKVIPVTVSGPGGVHRFRAEVAASPEEQSKGLMFRTEMGPDEGMIFPYDGSSAQAFWMKNTPLPLDIIFVGPDRKISNIAADTVPYSLDPVYSVGSVLAVFEINAGRAAALGIKPGDTVSW